MNPPPYGEKWRTRARRALERYFEKRSAPRLILSVLLFLTGTAGLVTSVLLLHAGLNVMWLRYPIAVLAAYAVFLGLLRGWVELEKSRFDPEPQEIERAIDEAVLDNPDDVTKRSGRSSWLDWLDFPGDFDGDEGCLAAALLIGLLIALIGLLIVAMVSASALIAEVFLDAFIITVLYRHLRVAAREHWLGTAVRKTWWAVLLTAALLSLAGWCLETMAPGAHSIGPALERVFGSQNPAQP